MIEVGEYIRTTKGKIEKVKTIHNTRFTDHSKMAYIKKYKEMAPESRILYNGHILIRDIVKHSKNIIDLIEVGDIVKVYVFADISDDDSEAVETYYRIESKYEITELKESVKMNYSKILSILTHEMYEQNCYKVGEN